MIKFKVHSNLNPQKSKGMEPNYILSLFNVTCEQNVTI
jgi:hypothetical protein